MPRVKCPKCERIETVLRSGFIRQKQRFLCKVCNYNFTLNHQNRKAKNKERNNYQTTINDLAKAMGLSATTVSRALRDYPDIGKQTKEAVKRLAIEMDYHPNLLARNFASKRTQTIGVVIPNLEATFFSSMLGGIQKAASQAGYKVLMCQSDENLKTEMENVQVLVDNRVDGLLICHSIDNNSYDQIRLLARKGMPIIHFYRVCMTTDTSKVLVRNTEGAELITQHLIDQGCKRIGIILGPEKLLISQERLKGYLNVLDANQLKVNSALIAYTDFKDSTVTAVVDKWLSESDRPDAIFCISDKCAIITLKYLKKMRIKVPNEIAVAGFGNDLMGELIDPALTTYDVNTAEIGKLASELFIEQSLNDENFIPVIKTIEGKLVVRESTIKTKDASN